MNTIKNYEITKPDGTTIKGEYKELFAQLAEKYLGEEIVAMPIREYDVPAPDTVYVDLDCVLDGPEDLEHIPKGVKVVSIDNNSPSGWPIVTFAGPYEAMAQLLKEYCDDRYYGYDNIEYKWWLTQLRGIQ